MVARQEILFHEVGKQTFFKSAIFLDLFRYWKSENFLGPNSRERRGDFQKISPVPPPPTHSSESPLKFYSASLFFYWQVVNPLE